MGLTVVEEGLALMLVGMGTVFLFLTLLVIATRLMSFVVIRLEPPPSADDVSRADASLDGETLAAITAAVAKHRHSRVQPRE